MRNFLFFTFVLLSFWATAQNNQIDSLKNQLLFQKESTARTVLFHELANAYWGEIDSADYYFQKAISAAQKIDPEFETLHTFWYADYLYKVRRYELSDSIFQIVKQQDLKLVAESNLAWITELDGLLEMTKGNFEKADSLLAIAITLYQNSEQNHMDLAEFYDNLGNYNNQAGKMEIAISWILKADSLYEIEGSKKNVSRTSLNLAINYINLERFELAEKFGQKALAISKEIDNPLYIAYSLSILGPAASELGKHELALSYSLECIDVWTDMSSDYNLATEHRTVGMIYKELNDLDNAAKHFEKSVQQLRTFEDDVQLVYSINQYALILIGLGKSSEGLAQLEESKRLFTQTNRSIPFQIDFNKNLEAAYAELKNYEAAYQYRNALDLLQDSIFNEEKLRQIEEIQTKYDVQKKDDQIALQTSELARKNQGLYAALALAGLLLVIIFLAWRNIQQRKNTNAQLQQLDRSKSRFFANISHELRTPLTLILAPLENTLPKIPSKEIKNHLNLAHSNAKKLLTLVNEILDLSKLESGKLQLGEQSVELESLLKRLLFSYHSLAQLQELMLSFSYHLPEGTTVKLDIDKFEKVINNLLSNAFKYSLPGGVVTLKASQAENGPLKIEVIDTGKGIRKEDLSKIFDRFYQAEDENEPLQGGTGIGLAYAKEIARLFGGGLSVESNLGEGSIFTFTLPFKKDSNFKSLPIEAEIYSLKTEEKATTEDLKNTLFFPERPKLLIVEDNFEMSRFLAQTLSKNYHCTTAKNGLEALEKLEKESFDLITSDVMMPIMDGFTLLEKIQEKEALHHTPVLLLTARALEEDKLKGFALGVDDYLTKPFSTKELIARINNLLKNKLARENWKKEEASKTESQPLSVEMRLLQKATDFVNANLDNPNFKIGDLANELNYSQRQLQRLLKKLTGFSPIEFVRELRLEHAHQLLEIRQFATVAEVCYAIGMENASYFSKVFKERYGKSPTEV